MKKIIFRSGIVIALITMTSFNALAQVECEAAQLTFDQKQNQLGVPPSGICGSLRYTVKSMHILIEFLNSCPQADPNGVTRDDVNTNLGIAEDGIRQAC